MTTQPHPQPPKTDGTPEPPSRGERVLVGVVSVLGVAAVLVATAALVMDPRPAMLAAMTPMAALGVAGALFPLWFRKVKTSRRARRMTSQGVFGVLAVGAAVNAVVALVAQEWLTAAYTGLLALLLAVKIPPPRQGGSEFLAITSMDEPMDERRKQIEQRSRADAFLMINLAAAYGLVASFFVNLIRFLREHGDDEPPPLGELVWPPLLALFAVCTVLELAYTRRNTRRM